MLPSPLDLTSRRARARRILAAFTVIASFSPVAISASRTEIEFVGVLATSQSTRFALSDTASGRTEWVTTGGDFAGYKLMSFDRDTDTLLLQRGTEELRVRLKDDAKVKSGRLELTGEISFGTAEKLTVERVTLLFDQENVFPLKPELTYRITPTRLPDGTFRFAIAIKRTLSQNKTETIAAPNLTTRPGQPFSLQFGDDLGFTFTPR